MNDKFKSHDFDYEAQEVSNRIRDEASYFDDVLSYLPDSREKSLAMTKLEECVMWANKAIALHGTNNE